MPQYNHKQGDLTEPRTAVQPFQQRFVAPASEDEQGQIASSATQPGNLHALTAAGFFQQPQMGHAQQPYSGYSQYYPPGYAFQQIPPGPPQQFTPGCAHQLQFGHYYHAPLPYGYHIPPGYNYQVPPWYGYQAPSGYGYHMQHGFVNGVPPYMNACTISQMGGAFQPKTFGPGDPFACPPPSFPLGSQQVYGSVSQVASSHQPYPDPVAQTDVEDAIPVNAYSHNGNLSRGLNASFDTSVQETVQPSDSYSSTDVIEISGSSGMPQDDAGTIGLGISFGKIVDGAVECPVVETAPDEPTGFVADTIPPTPFVNQHPASFGVPSIISHGVSTIVQSDVQSDNQSDTQADTESDIQPGFQPNFQPAVQPAAKPAVKTRAQTAINPAAADVALPSSADGGHPSSPPGQYKQLTPVALEKLALKRRVWDSREVSALHQVTDWAKLKLPKHLDYDAKWEAIAKRLATHFNVHRTAKAALEKYSRGVQKAEHAQGGKRKRPVGVAIASPKPGGQPASTANTPVCAPAKKVLKLILRKNTPAAASGEKL